jgi:hypothetical protein
MQDPKSLITRTLNLPFKIAREFDGSDAQEDTNFLMQIKFFCGLLRSKILKQAKQYFKEEVFTPWKMLCCMDIHGSKILLKLIDLLHTIKTDGKKYVSNTILWSSSTIK